MSWNEINVYFCFIWFSYWRKNTHKSGSGNRNFYRTTLGLRLWAKNEGCDMPILHEITSPLSPEPNTDLLGGGGGGGANMGYWRQAIL